MQGRSLLSLYYPIYSPLPLKKKKTVNFKALVISWAQDRVPGAGDDLAGPFDPHKAKVKMSAGYDLISGLVGEDSTFKFFRGCWQDLTPQRS